MTKSEPPFVIRAFEFLSSFVIRASSFSRHLPVFDQLVRNFFQKTRGPLEDIAVTAGQPHVWIGEIKLVARPCDRDVKQAPFFFESVARVERTTAREHAVREPDY